MDNTKLKYTTRSKKIDISSVEQVNMLINCVRDILYLIVLLRQKDYILTINAIDIFVIKEIEKLKTELKNSGFTDEMLDKSVYLVCAAVDEAYVYHKELIQDEYKSLIRHYYKEEFGGDNFFRIIEGLYENSEQNLPLMKLGYLLLSLGFQGKYAVRANEGISLNEIRMKLKSATEKVELQLSVPVKRNIFINLKFFKPKIFTLVTFIIITCYYTYCFLELDYEQSEIHELIRKNYL